MNIKKHSFDDAIDFSTLSLEGYKTGFQNGLDRGRENLAKLRQMDADKSPMQFLRSFTEMSDDLEEVSEVFFSLLGSDGTPEMHALAQQLSPELSRFGNEVALDQEIFKRIDSSLAYLTKQPGSSEWRRFTEQVHRNFVRNGVHLPKDKKNELEKIDEELGVLELKFRENVIKETAKFEMVVDEEGDLKGLPERDLEAAKQKANAKKVQGWLFTLDAPTYIPFVTYVEKRELREKMWRAFAGRCLGGDFDNRKYALRIAHLRQKRAHLLGFKSHAEFVLKERMAKSPEKVQEFLKRLISVAKPKAEKEWTTLKEFARSEGFKEEIKPWDSAFFAERFKKKLLKFDEEELRPYFPMEKVISGLFTHAEKLFGLKFSERNDVPKFHPENRVFEVKDSDDHYLGLFYMDLFPRPSKSPGAWMGSFRTQGNHRGVKRRPHVMNICNFTKPTGTKPSLLSFGEVETLFHEFGHALHELLSDCEVRGLSGTRVLWDFVELPSQIMENWVNHEEGLALVSSHYETGAKLPNDLVEKVKNSKKFMAGMGALRQAQLATLDLAWHHEAKIDETMDLEAFEATTLKPLAITERIPGTAISTSFGHIFAGGYAAGYYSYKWAEVLDADAFEYFEEQGVYNREIADKFRREILSRGNSEDPEVLYERFRGRKPDPDALFRREGLL